LERIALSQLKLSAVIRAPSGNRALVEDGTGKGYVVTNGTYMGLNSGKVVQIANDRIVVEEEVENVLGEYTLKSTELKLQKPAGEL
jgi:type IV pilus assembly protein PilP